MFDFGVDGLGKNVIVEENKGELEMKKYEQSAFVNFDISRCGVLVEDMSYCFLTYVANGTNPLIYGMQYVWVFYSDRIEKVNRIVADYSFSDYRLQGLWFFDEEHCFKDACN